MPGYENVVGGKLRLKGKALTVKEGLMKKNKKKKREHHYDQEIESACVSLLGETKFGQQVCTHNQRSITTVTSLNTF
ncbi:hypothetical protein DsansV1_C16g0141851 [Dioscorea sansibarensis]